MEIKEEDFKMKIEYKQEALKKLKEAFEWIEQEEKEKGKEAHFEHCISRLTPNIVHYTFTALFDKK